MRTKCLEQLLSRARISDNFANSSENIMRNRNSTPQNSKNPHAKWAAKPPFLVPFFRVLGLEFRFLIIFSEDFAKLSLILARDNSKLSLSLCRCTEGGRLFVVMYGSSVFFDVLLGGGFTGDASDTMLC